MRVATLVVCGVLVCLVTVMALDNGLGRVPPLGWNSWNKFGCNIDEQLIRATADAMVSSGLAAAGYQYVNIDDCWLNKQRNAQNQQVPSTERFPSGMKALSDYVHGKGLKLGIYSDAGSHTCAGYPGGRGFEKIDAQSYASWGIDYLKYDNCNADASDWIVDRYTAMRDALNQTGRPIYFSMCSWGVANSWQWGPAVGNSWRTDDDISDNWDSMLRCLDNCIGLSKYAGPGQWNDPDMLEVGNGGMTTNEYKSHFALWALFKSPLLIGCDVRNMSADTKAILTATEVIALSQDRLGVAGDLVWKEGPNEVYAMPLSDGSRGVVLFNRHTHATQYPLSKITVDFTDLGYGPTLRARVRDLYKRQDLGTFQGSFTADVDIHAGLALRITPIQGHESPSHVEWRPWHKK